MIGICRYKKNESCNHSQPAVRVCEDVVKWSLPWGCKQSTTSPLVICYIANWKMAIEIVDLPIDSMVIFHSYVNVYQRVY